MLFLRDDYVSYCVNEYVWVFGTWLEGQVDGLARKKKEADTAFNLRRQRLLTALLAEDGEEVVEKFAEPPMTMTRMA